MLKIVRSSWGSNPWPWGGHPQHFHFKISAKQNHDSIRISGSCFWVMLLVQSQLWMMNCKIFRLKIILSFSSQLDWWIPPQGAFPLLFSPHADSPLLPFPTPLNLLGTLLAVTGSVHLGLRLLVNWPPLSQPFPQSLPPPNSQKPGYQAPHYDGLKNPASSVRNSFLVNKQTKDKLPFVRCEKGKSKKNTWAFVFHLKRQHKHIDIDIYTG
jgi:hypothetical protein